MSEVKSNPMKDFGIPTIVLTLICAIAAAAMVCVYEITAPIIAANTKAAADAARAEVYVGVSGFEEIDVSAFENCEGPLTPGMIRVSFGIYNTEEEVDMFLAALPVAIEAAKKELEEHNNSATVIREYDPAY